MGKLKTSSKLKSATSAKAWEMLLNRVSPKVIAKELGYTTAAIRGYAKQKFKAESMRLWSKQIKTVGMCEIPGCYRVENLQAHHLLSKKTWPHLSRDLSNGVSLCGKHHTFDEAISPHTNMPAMQVFVKWLEHDRNGQFVWYEEYKHDEKHQAFDYEAAYWELKAMP